MEKKSMSSVTILVVAALLVIGVTFLKTVVLSDIEIHYPQNTQELDYDAS